MCFPKKKKPYRVEITQDVFKQFDDYYKEYLYYTKLMSIYHNDAYLLHYYYDKIFNSMIKMTFIIDLIEKNSSLVYDRKNECFKNRE
jgi:hypothetical protein